MIAGPLIGETLRDTYTVLEKLGEGAFSEVFLVRHRFLGLQAMKIFKADSPGPTSDQFKEAFILSKLAHPNIVRIFEANKVTLSGRERSYVTMEHAVRGTLHSFVSTRSMLSVEMSICIQKQICAGLSAAHSQKPPIIHRDIKPQNVLLTGDDSDLVAKIADFGLARNVDPKLRMVSAAGTLLYMPPEGFHHYETCASDVYSAGIIFYQMLTGTFPFLAVDYTTEQEFRLGLAKTRSGLPVPPSQVAPHIPRRYDSICLQALRPDLHKRFQTATEFLSALESTEKASEPESLNSQPGNAALEKAREAVQMGTQYADLSAAMVLLEEAIREAPTLAQEYGPVLAKWKSGVVF